MKIGRIVIASFTAPLLFTAVALAQPAPAAPAHPSDYLKDVQSGQDLLKNDTDAAKQSDEVKTGEIVEGDIDNSEVNVDDAVDQDEADVSDSAVTESGDSKSSNDSSSASDPTDSSSKSDSSPSSMGDSHNSTGDTN